MQVDEEREEYRTRVCRLYIAAGQLDEAVEEYKELNDLRSWVQEATNWLKVSRYTLAQLREVKKILEGGADM